MSKPELYIFTISHYCEKAWWALDYLGFDTKICTLAPGSHIKVAQKLGLSRGSVPFLKTNDSVIQGSASIINWAEEHTQSGKSLGGSNDQVRACEKRLDDRLGVHIRRWFYSEAILDCPQLVKPIFMHDQPLWEKLKLSLSWPVIRKLMIKGMDLGPQQGLDSLEIVKQEIDWIESQISTNRAYLVGDTFSRADIAAASLLAPLVTPPEYHCSKLMKHPSRAQGEAALMVDRPFWAWVTEQYRVNRI